MPIKGELNLDKNQPNSLRSFTLKKNNMNTLKLNGQSTKKSFTFIWILFSLERSAEGLKFDESSNDEG